MSPISMISWSCSILFTSNLRDVLGPESVSCEVQHDEGHGVAVDNDPHRPHVIRLDNTKLLFLLCSGLELKQKYQDPCCLIRVCFTLFVHSLDLQSNKKCYITDWCFHGYSSLESEYQYHFLIWTFESIQWTPWTVMTLLSLNYLPPSHLLAESSHRANHRLYPDPAAARHKNISLDSPSRCPGPGPDDHNVGV